MTYGGVFFACRWAVMRWNIKIKQQFLHYKPGRGLGSCHFNTWGLEIWGKFRFFFNLEEGGWVFFCSKKRWSCTSFPNMFWETSVYSRKKCFWQKFWVAPSEDWQNLGATPSKASTPKVMFFERFLIVDNSLFLKANGREWPQWDSPISIKITRWHDCL